MKRKFLWFGLLDMVRMSKLSLFVLSCSFISQIVYAQSFNEINKVLKVTSGNIQLQVRKFEGINPVNKFVLAQNSPQLTFDNWNLQLNAKPVANHPEALDITANFKLTGGVSLLQSYPFPLISVTGAGIIM